MSIAHLKKQAKNLVRLLPAHIKSNPAGGSLATCQELIARASGFPSFHAAATTHESSVMVSKPRLFSSVILGDLVALQDDIDNDSESWLGRVRSLATIVYSFQVDLERQGKSFAVDSVYEIETLDAALKQALSEIKYPHANVMALAEYLNSVPGYQTPKARGQAPILKEAKDQHDFLIGAIARLEKKLPVAEIKHKPIDVVNHGDGHFTVYVNPSIAEDHLRASLERLCKTATSLEFNGDHPALNRIYPDLARQGIYIAPYRAPLAMASLHLPLHMIEKLFPKQGLVLISSCDGNGKTAFRIGIADALLDRPDSRKVISYEGPIEYKFKQISRSGSISQTLCGDTKTQAFKTSLHQAMRRKPDAILAGEVRDVEYIETVALVAMTGHAMYAEVHADSAVDAVMNLLKRIPSQQVERLSQNLIASLSLVTWQTLVTGINGKCIAIYEFLSFSNEMKDDLLALDMTNQEAIRQLLNTELQRQGDDLISNAKVALRESRISQDTFNDLKAMRKKRID